MADDDKERGGSARSKPLPPSVERALARARARSTDKSVLATIFEKLSGGKGRAADRWLALVPVGLFVTMGALMIPRSAPPVDTPLPEIDERALDAVTHEDAMRVAAAKTTRLPGDVLALGSAIRAFNALQGGAAKATEEDAVAARAAIDDARTLLGTRETGPSDLLTLRAVQLDAFLGEVGRFEETGVVSPNLEELGGAFIDRMRDAGWVTGSNHVLLTQAQRRAAFKVVWNAVAGVDQLLLFQLTLDEQRALYTLYLAHPHVAEGQRTALEAQRAAAKTEAACDRVDFDERRSLEMWRVEKIKRLGALDPTYPTAFALGGAYYRAGRYDLSIESYRSWLAAHPEGPLALRAQNHLRAAVTAYGPL